MPVRKLLASCLVVSLSVACGGAPADSGDTPPDFNAVSSSAVCLPNGTVHDPNPPGCSQFETCQYGDPGYADDSDHRNWSDGEYKKQCARTDWMTALTTTDQRYPSYFHCEMTPYTTSSGASAEINRGDNNNVYPSVYNGVSQAKTDAGLSYDWDPPTDAGSYERAECAKTTQFISGFSWRKGSQSNTYQLEKIRCATLLTSDATMEVNNNCRGVVFNDDNLEQTDNRETTATGNWDGASDGGVLLLADGGAARRYLECATGSHMVGISRSGKNLHGILCCDGAPTFTPTTSATCCNETTYEASLVKCLSNPTKYLSHCNLIDYCCQPGVSSYAGSASCAEAAYAEDPTAEGGTGLTVTPASTPAAPTTASGSSSLTSTISNVRGNNGFGGGYEATVNLTATKSSLNASAESKVKAQATIFGKTVILSELQVKGSLSTQAGGAYMKVLGLDVWAYSQTGLSHTISQSKTQTFFSQSKSFMVGPVPLTIEASITGTVGMSETISLANTQLSVSGGPSVDFTVTAFAGIGGSMGGFKLTAGVEGSLTLFTASCTGSTSITPTASNLTYNVNAGLQVSEISGDIKAKLEAKLLIFKKTWTRKLIGFKTSQQTKTFLSYTKTATW